MRSLAVLLLAGCAAQAAEIPTSRTYLTQDDSGATLTLAPRDAAREILSDLAPRGFALADETDSQGTMILKLTRQSAIGLGSTVYAWIRPAPAGSTVALVAKPTVLGAEGCSAFTPGQACNTALSDEAADVSDTMNGETEAEDVRGLLLTLKLKGFAVGPAPASAVPTAPVVAANPSCLAARHAVFAQAAQASSANAKAKVLATAPECPLEPVP